MQIAGLAALAVAAVGLVSIGFFDISPEFGLKLITVLGLIFVVFAGALLFALNHP